MWELKSFKHHNALSSEGTNVSVSNYYRFYVVWIRVGVMRDYHCRHVGVKGDYCCRWGLTKAIWMYRSENMTIPQRWRKTTFLYLFILLKRHQTVVWMTLFVFYSTVWRVMMKLLRVNSLTNWSVNLNLFALFVKITLSSILVLF